VYQSLVVEASLQRADTRVELISLLNRLGYLHFYLHRHLLGAHSEPFIAGAGLSDIDRLILVSVCRRCLHLDAIEH
jgi:hypothetical protein